MQAEGQEIRKISDTRQFEREREEQRFLCREKRRQKELISQRGIKKYSSGGSKVEVSLVNPKVWKKLCEIGNEMRIHYQTQ